LFEDSRRRDARKIGAARSRRQRQGKPDDVVRRVSDNGLIEISDLDGNASIDGRDRPEVSRMTVAADPNRRSFWKRAALLILKPCVEFDGAAAHVSVCRAGHFKRLPSA
jgi:hypothetical protein